MRKSYFSVSTYIYLEYMRVSNRLSLLSAAALCAALFWACNDEPDPKTMAKSDAPAAAPKQEHAKLKAKVRKSLGDANLQRKSEGNWSQLRIGQSVVEKDRIRTGAESEAILSVNDGSALWITELSEVTLDVEIFDSLSRQVSVIINNGGVHFDVQKQKKGNTLMFRTGVATAAIRGTAGFVGGYNGQMVASLKEGLVDVNKDGGEGAVSVGANQTVLVGKDGQVRRLQLKSSGTRALSLQLANVNIFGEGPMDSLEKALTDFDNDYAARVAAFEKKLRFQAAPLSAQVFFPNVTLQARVNPGVVVTVLGESDTVGANGVYQRTFEWDDDAYGTKRFLATCSEGDVEVQCFMWVTEYEAPAPVEEAAPAADSAADTAAVAEPEPTPAPAKAEPKKEEVKKEKPKAEPKKEEVKKEEPKAEPKKEEAKKEEPKKEEVKKEEPKKEETGRDLKSLTLKMGAATERKHLDLPATEYSTDLKFSLGGITRGDLSEIKEIVVTRKGKVVKSFSGAELDGLEYAVPVTIGLNKIASFDVKIVLKNGKSMRRTKTYEVYCERGNHMGKARNFIKYKTVEEEYEAVKSKLEKE